MVNFDVINFLILHSVSNHYNLKIKISNPDDYHRCLTGSSPFKRKPHKMVRHTEIIRRQEPTNCLSVFDQFVVLALKRLNMHILLKASYKTLQDIWKKLWYLVFQKGNCCFNGHMTKSLHSSQLLKWPLGRNSFT